MTDIVQTPSASSVSLLTMCIEVQSSVKNMEMPWNGLLSGGLVKKDTIDVLRRYQNREEENEKIAFIEVAKAALELLKSVSKDETVMFGLLTLLELTNIGFSTTSQTVTTETAEKHSANEKEIEKHIVELMADIDVFGPLIPLLSRQHIVSEYWAAKLIAFLLSSGENITDQGDQNQSPFSSAKNSFISWVVDRLSESHVEAQRHAASGALRVILTKREWRDIISNDGLICERCVVFATSLIPTGSFQPLYDTLYCMWLLSFVENGRMSLINARVVNCLVRVMRQSHKEKVVRMAISVFSNLEKDSRCVEDAIHDGLLNVLLALQLRQWSDDDISTELEEMVERVETCVAELSSFDRYKSEALSGKMKWGPVHQSTRFWKDNHAEFEAKDYQTLRILLKLLKNSQDTTTQAICCHDIGEFTRFHPDGKAIIEHLGGKPIIMGFMEHKDPTVQREALLCVQKMMVQGWRFLGGVNTEQ